MLIWSVVGGVFGFGFFDTDDRGEVGVAEGRGELRFPASDCDILFGYEIVPDAVL